MIFLLAVVTACSGEEVRPPVNSEDILGRWVAPDGRSAVFLSSGVVQLEGVSCREVFMVGDQRPKLVGRWQLPRVPETVDARVAMKFPTGACGQPGPSESTFYVLYGSEGRVLHLRDPDMLDENLNFARTPAGH